MHPEEVLMRARPFFVTGILGLGTVLMTLIMTAIGPRPAAPLPAGFITPVLAYEFATTDADVAALFAPVGQPAGETVRAAMDRVNRLDFLYIVFYGGFLTTFALVCARATRQPVFLLAAALAPLIMLADVLENVQLLAITARLGTTDIAVQLARLRWFTWLKWGGLALWFLLLRPYFLARGGFGRAIALASLLPLVLGVVAFLWPGLASELFALAVGLLFILLTVYAWRYRPPAAVPVPAL